MLNKPHILVFDSGLGGTTVLREIQTLLPDAIYSYALDNDAFPYGQKSNDFLLQRCVPLFTQLIQLAAPTIIVIACNTASTLLLNTLRQAFPHIAFVGVVPAIKPAAQLSHSKVIGLLATEATVNRSYVDELQAAHAADCTLVRLGTAHLVALAENKMRGEAVDLCQLQAIVSEFLALPNASAVDTIVLGCTHFPLLRDELSALWPTPIVWIDSGAAIAKRVQSLVLQPHNTLPMPYDTNAYLFITSVTKQEKITAALQKQGAFQVQLITINKPIPTTKKQSFV